MAVAMLTAGCTAEDEPQQAPQQPVAVDFALTVAKSVSPGTTGITRMASTNIVGSVDKIALEGAIPFHVSNAEVPIAFTDHFACEPIGNFSQSHESLPYFTSSCGFISGVNAVLAYARSTNNVSSKAKGVLNVTFGEYQPADISFRLKTIQTREEYYGISGDTDVETVAEQLADYLTDIANTSIGEGENIMTWKAYATSGTMNADLKMLFKNFTNQLSDEVGEVLPGSSANVRAWVTALKTSLNALTSLADDDLAIRTAIIANIDAELDKLDPSTGVWKNFPASVNLPDGAAVVRWDGEKFVPETQTTTIADINNIDRLAYPAEIYYYGNSPTMVSDDNLSSNFSSKNKWAKANESDENAVLSGFTQGPVAASTKTVAMRDPLEYGVAQLVIMLKRTTESLPDSKNTAVAVGNNFKLTGIIVGGQLPVGFDFRPESIYPVYSEADMRFIYDCEVNTNNTDGNVNDESFFYLSSAADATNTIQTLVLQSYTGRSLKLVLELENNSADFEGYNGKVYKGTKFYLVGEVMPTAVDNNPQVYDNRVFTKDHITTINVTVNSLAKAYNVLPNLMSPRLEMGLELTPKWVQATTSDVIL